MKTLWFGIVVCCGLCASVFAQAELRGTETDLTDYLSKVSRTVFVGGQAEVKAQADRAVVRLKVTTTGKGLEQALQSNQLTRSKLIEFLSGRGIPAGQVQASKFSSTPKYGVLSERVKSYRVEHLLKVTVQNEEQFQAVAKAVDTTPTIEYLGVDLEHSNQDGLKAQAIGRACENANERKKVFEERLGLKLTAKGFNDPIVPTTPSMKANPNRAIGFSGGTAPSFTGVVTGVLTDPSFYVVAHALDQRQEGEPGFGELVFQAQVRVEYSAERR
jgi:uncharacterized protein YggE